MAMVRVDEATVATLRELARQKGEPMADIAAKAVEEYRRKVMLREANAQYAALRADPAAWKEARADVAAWDATLADGLENW